PSFNNVCNGGLGVEDRFLEVPPILGHEVVAKDRAQTYGIARLESPRELLELTRAEVLEPRTGAELGVSRECFVESVVRIDVAARDHTVPNDGHVVRRPRDLGPLGRLTGHPELTDEPADIDRMEGGDVSLRVRRDVDERLHELGRSRPSVDLP